MKVNFSEDTSKEQSYKPGDVFRPNKNAHLALKSIWKNCCKLVYCRDSCRKGKYSVKSKKTWKLFLGYDCAIYISLQKHFADKLGELEIKNLSFKSILGITQYLNMMIRRLVNYYGRFRGYELLKVFQLLRKHLVHWTSDLMSINESKFPLHT